MTTARGFGFALLAGAALLSACTAPPAAEPPAPQADSSAAGVVSADFEVVGGQVDGRPERIQAPLGSLVRFTVRSDGADGLHVHGYDKSAPLRPGEPATVEFRADIPGAFEIELHHSGPALPSLVVR
ncbi:hypothetical protein SAMN05216215_1004133 [Saccharopolyspora shandongensis]|uniref:Cupredoxin-like domain-containing protein n=1 Tax=Saccharopolyspora shandongensis TaxID=418495 RepID=A0A1H2UYG6_9PSEU|nr:hypothetical protein [Saccharopolyspora shandongensis]SDW61105.1 hypothetical protein SAMN05216215_1004133 [Saccharopolyspora shandongensis]